MSSSLPNEGIQVGVGFSHQTLLTASVVGFVGVAVVVYALIVSRVKTDLDDDDNDEYEEKSKLNCLFVHARSRLKQTRNQEDFF